MYKKVSRYSRYLASVVLLALCSVSSGAQEIIIKSFSIVSPKSNVSAELLSSEIGKRTGLKAALVNSVPASGDVIILKTKNSKTGPAADSKLSALKEKSEAYRIYNTLENNRQVITIEGYDERGVLMGAGNLLRIMQYRQGSIAFDKQLAISTAPDKELRGHQLGYRNTANSWDGWTKEQMEQYIRDLVVFGS